MRLAPTTVGGTRAMATESAYAHANPVSADVVIRSFAGPQLVTIDEPTENLIHQLFPSRGTLHDDADGRLARDQSPPRRAASSTDGRNRRSRRPALFQEAGANDTPTPAGP